MISEKLIIGGAQLGQPYGLFKKNDNGKNIINSALHSNITMFDTAPSYGNSEKLLGKTSLDTNKKIMVTTKVMNNFEYISKKNLLYKLKTSIEKSMDILGQKNIYGVLLHRADVLHNHKKQDYEYCLANLKKIYPEIKLGFSIQNPQELNAAINNLSSEIIQLPVNILEHRWNKYLSQINELRKNGKLEIHARSCFLQGLLLNPDEYSWRSSTGLEGLSPLINWYINQFKVSGCTTYAEFCIQHCIAQDYIDKLIIGVDDIPQLKALIEILLRFEKKSINSSGFPKFDITLLDPAKWRKHG